MIQLTDEIKAAINGALDDGYPLVMVAVDENHAPAVSFRGSTQTFGDQALAVWVRNPDSTLIRSIASNPRVALVYNNMSQRRFWLFYGRAREVTDAAVREAIWKGQHALEKGQDPDRKGRAVLVELDRVMGHGVEMSRD